ncbi:aminotransferase family protein [Vallitalea guaymasensis]|uniref:Aspartate aminotransferase family protein n=1 Tax=Vallitalea guaymasensis TaxID=1185412 RepID=A0A8J8SDG9_9FIRM|nr:aminotransferase class III-fold pyridoxal phosphate-dependent enzyme [Vallitalea guaymasensis]QUH30863.1 aspartate aminotransferase family protein [Vallitalea guaymasensis]
MNNLNLRNVISHDMDFKYPVWHPYSSVNKDYFSMRNFVRGEGIYLFDVNNKKYIDASSGLWNIALGYGNERIISAINKQLYDLPFTSLFYYTNPIIIACANKILSFSECDMKKVFFTCSGSESIELAIKTMREYWTIRKRDDKKTIISFNNSYHGTHYGSMGVSGLSRKHIAGYGPLVDDIVFFDPEIEQKDVSKNERDNEELQAIEEYIIKNHDRIAGILIEPILASNGVSIITDRYIDMIQRLCIEYNILITVDEVTVGFYRTGEALYSNSLSIEPDIICMAKGINNGYLPLGAVMFNEKIYSVYNQSDKLLYHGTTQGGNLASCAACIAAIEEYSRLNIGENVKHINSYLMDKLSKNIINHKNVNDIWGKGCLIQIELIREKKNNSQLSIQQIGILKYELLKKGLIVSHAESGLTLLPMLIMNEEQVDELVGILEQVFSSIVF